jgi:hypothetical protein
VPESLLKIVKIEKIKMEELTNKIRQKLDAFDTLPDIQASEDWQQSVIDRLAVTQSDTNVSFSTRSLLIVGFLFIGLNIGFILKTTLSTPSSFVISTTREQQRTTNFKTISKELLSNPTTINH